MTTLSINNLSKKYGSVEVLKSISLEADEGEFVVLLGPSGCGKSTLLHAIAGLIPIEKGDISIEGRVVNNVPTRDRNIAMVFQSYALYPNMTVGANIGFPLKMRNFSKAEIDERVMGVAKTLQLEALLERFPRQLSGGQRQRVAIGRSLVRDSSVFLFDEPLSNLDATLRVETRSEIKKLHQRIRKTMVYVTHDQIEAMTLATKIVIMNKGRIQQIGTPEDVYHRPANLFVAKFIGSPAITLLDAKVGSKKNLLCGEGGDQFAVPIHATSKLVAGKKVLLGLRPEQIRLGKHGGVTASGTVELVEPTGPEDLVLIQLNGQMARARFPTNAVKQGQKITVDLDVSGNLLFDSETEARIH
jgi:ABC-type sugar transport system ATPase subunit